MRYVTAADNKERSKPHRRVEACLDEIGISYFSEHSLWPYKVDIYIPEWHLAIEVDGPFHSQSKDKIRDNFLYVMYGLIILRLNMKIWHSKRSIKDRVIAFIEHNADTAEDRKTRSVHV